jgi:hypothetical protein
MYFLFKFNGMENSRGLSRPGAHAHLSAAADDPSRRCPRHPMKYPAIAGQTGAPRAATSIAIRR